MDEMILPEQQKDKLSEKDTLSFSKTSRIAGPFKRIPEPTEFTAAAIAVRLCIRDTNSIP